MKEIVIIVQSLQGIKKYDFNKDIISIGRSKENDIILDDETVSSFHTSLTFDPALNVYILMDLNSKNGTFIEDRCVKEPYPIDKVTLVKIGKNKLQIFPTEIKEGQKTVMFDIEDFKRNIPQTISKEIDAEKIPTIPISKIKTEPSKDFSAEKTILEKKQVKLKLRLIFLEGEHKGKIFDLPEEKKEIIFGRSKECDFCFSDQRISRVHFKLKIQNSSIFIKNLKPINPVYLDKKEISDKDTIVENNSIISVHDEKIKIIILDEEKAIVEKTIERPKELSIETKVFEEKIKLYIIKGPLNIDYYYKLENLLISNLSSENKWAIIDFKDITVIDYPALASLLKMIAEYTQIGGTILLTNISDELDRTFELVNVANYLKKFKKKNIEEAKIYLLNLIFKKDKG